MKEFNQRPTVYFLIGASGAGKTTISRALERENTPKLKVCYFDSIGVPSVDDMISEYGSSDEWQRAKTKEWVKRIQQEFLSTKDVILDAQTRPSFIEEACKEHNLTRYKIILVDCSNETRKERLLKRGQPELASDDMMNWARYLRKACEDKNYDILDTTHLTMNESVNRLRECIGRVSE